MSSLYWMLSLFLSAEQNAFPFIGACFMFMVADLLKQNPQGRWKRHTCLRRYWFSWDWGPLTRKRLPLTNLRRIGNVSMIPPFCTEETPSANPPTFLLLILLVNYTAFYPSLFYIYIRFSNEIGSSPPDYEIHQHHWIWTYFYSPCLRWQIDIFLPVGTTAFYMNSTLLWPWYSKTNYLYISHPFISTLCKTQIPISFLWCGDR